MASYRELSQNLEFENGEARAKFVSEVSTRLGKHFSMLPGNVDPNTKEFLGFKYGFDPYPGPVTASGSPNLDAFGDPVVHRIDCTNFVSLALYASGVTLDSPQSYHPFAVYGDGLLNAEQLANRSKEPMACGGGTAICGGTNRRFNTTLFEDNGETPTIGAIGLSYKCEGGALTCAKPYTNHAFIVTKVYPDGSIEIVQSGGFQANINGVKSETLSKADIQRLRLSFHPISESFNEKQI